MSWPKKLWLFLDFRLEFDRSAEIRYELESPMSRPLPVPLITGDP